MDSSARDSTDLDVLAKLGRWCAVVAVLGLAGCGAPGSGDQTATLPIAFPLFGLTAPGRPVDVYVMLARQTKACWLTVPAPLSEGYVFTAEAKPEFAGGTAGITLFERNTAEGVEGQKGLLAYSIGLSPESDATRIKLENARIPESFAAKMEEDVTRWAKGETGCSEFFGLATAAATGPAKEQDGRGKAHARQVTLINLNYAL